MIIELKEYELPKGKGIFDIDSYSSTGLYIVNDGISMHIISVIKVGERPIGIPIPFDILNQFIRNKASKETELDIGAKIIKRLDDINNKIDDLFEQKSQSDTTQIYHEEKIDGETLLKAIALAQNPDLAHKLLLNE